MTCSCSVSPRPKISFRYLFGEEPYRLLFPLGIAVGMYGLLLWPAFVYKLLPMYPGVAHARIMIEGFVFSFVVGFLGTAMPHMLEVGFWPRRVTACFAAGICGIVGLHQLGHHAAGDGVFALLLVWMVGLLVCKLPRRKDLPPPGFPSVGLGMLCGVVGAVLLAVGGGLFATRLGKLLLYQGFVLLPILGIGTFLTPRMLGLPNRQKLADDPRVTPAWRRKALEHLGFAGLLLISFGLEAAGWVCAGWLLRAAAFAGNFLSQVPLWRAGPLKGSIARWLPAPFLCIPLGYVLMVVFPEKQIDLLHVVMVSGYALLIVVIATRVALGHGGGGDRLYVRLRSVNWLGGLTMLAMATRVSAPWLRKGPWSHYAYAGITLAVVLLWWLVRFAPYLATDPREEEA